MKSPITLVCVAASVLSASLSAQVTIVKGVAPSGFVRSMNNNNNSLALTPDGAIWAVVYVVDKAGTNGHLELRRSLTHGNIWLSGTYPLPNNTSHNNHHNNSGCIVAGRDGDKLHVTWADRTANASYWSAMYQVFNTNTLKWVGTPKLLAKGYGANNQFWPVDIAMTAKGTLAVCISGHRAGGLGLGPWDCGLAVKPRGGSFNTTLLNLRKGGASYSQNASIVSVDETIHCCMKNSTGGYGICYRAYDTEGKKWNQASQVFVGPNNNAGIAAGNKSAIAADRDGGLYVIYCTGSSSAPRTLRLAYAAPGKGGSNADWKDFHIIKNTQTIGTNYRKVAAGKYGYPQIQGGNSNTFNYTLASAAGGNVFAVYSKSFETFASLYVQGFNKGSSVLPEVKISGATKPYSFEWITGIRNGDHSYSAAWLSFGKTDAPSPNNGTYPNGQVDFWRLGSNSIARSVALGTGCQGKLAKRPRVHAYDTLPTLGTTFKIQLDRFPASANFFLAIGTSILLPPLNLGFMYSPTCDLNNTFPLIVPLQVPSSGVMTIPWNVPNDPNLIGARVYAQCLVVSPGSTPGNVVTTNSLCVILGT